MYPLTVDKGHVFRSHGKINWFLGIGDLRKDGYHEVCSLMQQIALYDEIEVTLASSDSISCNHGVPVGEGSLLQRTLVALRILYPSLSAVRFAIRIKKAIPPGSGLGGGSSNVAVLLASLPVLGGVNFRKEELLKIAADLGSDVPFFLYQVPFALIQGRGEKVIPLYPCPKRFLVLLFPPFSVSTSWAYRKWDEELIRGGIWRRDTERTLETFLKKWDDEMIEKVVWNDFEPLVFRHYPAMRTYREILCELGCEKVFMTGSGSTLVGVVENQRKGWEVVEELKRRGIRAILTSTIAE